MAENHLLARLGWLRAAVLGANDGILSTAGLIMGVAGAGASTHAMALAGFAGLVAGACSMAAGEFVSVSAQADTENAAIAAEQAELDASHKAVVRATYPAGSHIPDPQAVLRTSALDAEKELGLSEQTRAKPMQAALASAGSFTVGALLPLAVVLLAPAAGVFQLTFLATILSLCALGAAGAWLSGTPIRTPVTRVGMLGIAALLVAVWLGNLVGAHGL